MASPQAENGHIDIANEIADRLATIRIPGREMQILWVIFRKTWGWHKKTDTISQSQFAKSTGIARRHIGRLLEGLLEKALITKNGDGFICEYGIQKDWEQWQLSPKTVIVTKNGDSNKLSPNLGSNITKNGDETVTKNGAHKRKERTYTKESIDVVFSFWKETLNHPKAILSKDRIGFIKARIKEGHTVEECKQAILGCKASSYHMGDNDRHKIYDSIELIFRKGDKFEQFIGYLNQTDNSDIDNLPDLMEE